MVINHLPCTITDIKDQLGTVIQRYSYSSFGKILKVIDGSGNETTNPIIKPHYTFTNREIDEEIGLYYYRARYYDAGTGRFLQEDPHPGISRLPSTVYSKYIYATNSPSRYTDPNGRFIHALAIGAIAGAVVGGLNAFISGNNLAEGILYGAVSGASVAGGMLLGAGLVGAGAGFLATASVSGVLAGFINGTAFIIVSGDPKMFNTGFVSGFIGAFVGTAVSKLGILEGADVATNSPELNNAEAASSLGGVSSPKPPLPNPVPHKPYTCAPIGQYEPNPICY